MTDYPDRWLKIRQELHYRRNEDLASMELRLKDIDKVVDRLALEKLDIKDITSTLRQYAKQSPGMLRTDDEQLTYLKTFKRGYPRPAFWAAMTVSEKLAFSNGEPVPARLTAPPLPDKYKGMSPSLTDKK
jgi:excinuclease UvrABC ATPase subunit